MDIPFKSINEGETKLDMPSLGPCPWEPNDQITGDTWPAGAQNQVLWDRSYGEVNFCL